MSKLCIEFGSNSIRFAKGKFNKGFHIESFFTLLLDGESLIDSPYEEKFLGSLIKNELGLRKIKDKGVNFIISAMPNMLVREIDVPKAKKSDTYKMVKQEAGVHFPINLNNYVIDYRVVGEFQEKGIKKQKLICIAVPKFLVERLIEIANAAELKLEKIDIEANTLCKFLYEYQRQLNSISEHSNIICAVQDTYITMVVTKKGVIQMSKTTSYESVMLRLKSYGFDEAASTREADIENIYNEVELDNLDEAQGEIADGIIRYMNFYTSKYREDIESVYIIGELGEKLDIASAIKLRMDVDVRKIDNLNVYIKNKNYKEKDVSEYKNVFGGLLK